MMFTVSLGVMAGLVVGAFMLGLVSPLMLLLYLVLRADVVNPA